MDDVRRQIECEEARKLAEYYARQASRDQISSARSRRWRAELVRRQDEQAERKAERERRCGAKTRAGHSCQRKGLGKGGRCPNHGGMSTGPRTKAGRKRIAEAQRRRWEKFRNASAGSLHP